MLLEVIIEADKLLRSSCILELALFTESGVKPTSLLEALFDSRSDIEMTAELEDIDRDVVSIAEPLEPPDISTDSVEIAELTTPLPPAPKTALSARLSQTPELSGQSCRDAIGEHPQQPEAPAATANFSSRLSLRRRVDRRLICH
jgi:hypothetical protein